MKQFFKFMFASMLGFFISIFIIMFFFFLFSFAVISSFDSGDSVSITKNTVLELQLNYEVPERTSYEPIFSYTVIPSMERTIGLNDIIKLIHHAKNNHNIEGIFLNLDHLSVGGLTKITSIRKALIDFKSSHKFIIAHGNSISEKGFYLASVADSIYLTPTGSLEFDGFGMEVTFFKKALDKLEIEPQIFQHGKFKSATEPFKLSRLSEQNRKQLLQYLNSVYSDFLENISLSTKIDKESLKDLSNNLKISSAEDAKNHGLITGLLYKDEVDSLINNLVNNSLKPKRISEKKYLSSLKETSSSSTNRIAVIYAIGEITNGSGDEFSIGTKNIIKSIKKAKDNKRVKAIVLRINSPGGSPLTSDMIWREINLAKELKPVIVSMGSIAASGGYYIACSADKIIAESTTLTGSIGVFGIVPNTQKFFDNKLGITFDRVGTSQNSGLGSITSPMNFLQKKYFQKQVDDIYVDFVSRVSEGRNMTFEEVDKIAEGRIWSGINAKEIGLVDTLGDLTLAMEIAAQAADIEDYKIVEYPDQKEAFEKLLELFSSKIDNKISEFMFDEPLNQIKKLRDALKYTGIQTRLPFEYVIY